MERKTGSPNLLFENVDLDAYPIRPLEKSSQNGSWETYSVQVGVRSPSPKVDADLPDFVHKGLSEMPQMIPILEAYVRIL